MNSIAIYGLFFILIIVGIVTLVIVAKLYFMHDVRNSDGEFAWMVPDSWVKVQDNMIKTQELMIGSMAELTVHNKQISKLLETNTNASLMMYEELIKMREEDK